MCFELRKQQAKLEDEKGIGGCWKCARFFRLRCLNQFRAGEDLGLRLEVVGNRVSRLHRGSWTLVTSGMQEVSLPCNSWLPGPYRSAAGSLELRGIRGQCMRAGVYAQERCLYVNSASGKLRFDVPLTQQSSKDVHLQKGVQGR